MTLVASAALMVEERWSGSGMKFPGIRGKLGIVLPEGCWAV